MDTIATGEILKVDESLGLVFGWAMVCNKNGEPYIDLQNDHIPESTMLKSATDFMGADRVMSDMHQVGADGKAVKCGTITFMFPLTAEVAKAFDITTKTTELMIAAKPDSAEILAKYKNGTYKGFSIGGTVEASETINGS